MFRHACRLGLDGMVSKRATSRSPAGAVLGGRSRIRSTRGDDNAMKVRDFIARLSALRVAGLLDEWGEELVGTLERQAARGQGPTELLKRFHPEIVAGALADHMATLTPEKVERIHRDARGREKDST